MMDDRDRLLQAQGDLIRKHNEERRTFQSQIERYQKKIDLLDAKLEIWNDLQEQVRNNPTIRSEWEHFLMILKLGADESYLKKSVPTVIIFGFSALAILIGCLLYDIHKLTAMNFILVLGVAMMVLTVFLAAFAIHLLLGTFLLGASMVVVAAVIDGCD